MRIFSEVQSFLLPLYFFFFFFFFKPDVDVIARFINTVDRATHTIYISRADPRIPALARRLFINSGDTRGKKENGKEGK